MISSHMCTRTTIWIRRCFSTVLTFSLLLLGFYSNAQDAAFDLAYDKIWKESTGKDLPTAISQGDSLYHSSSMPVRRMRCLMLIARLYQQKEDLAKSVEFAAKLEQLAVENSDCTWQTRRTAIWQVCTG